MPVHYILVNISMALMRNFQLNFRMDPKYLEQYAREIT